MTITPEQLTRTGRWIHAGIWVCAAITMTASVVNGTSVFDMLTTGALGVLVGLLTSLAVDAALVVVLTGDGRMHQLGLPTVWGRVLRWVTLGMSLALNCGASIKEGHYFLAALHSIPPLLLCGLAEYGQEVALAFTERIREREEQRHTAEDTLRREAREREAAEATRLRRLQEAKDLETHKLTVQEGLTAEAARTAEALERKTAAERELAGVEAERVAMVARATGAPRLSLVNPRGRKTAPAKRAGRPSPVRDQAFAYLRKQHNAGRDIRAIGPTEIADAIGASRNTVKKGHKEWRDAVLTALGVAS